LAPLGSAAAFDLGMVTGSEKGTYYQFGLNLQALAKQKGINLAVHASRGSIENVFAVYQRPGVQMGIVQSDVLAFVARVETDPVLKRIARKTKMIFPLYNEEVHLIGRPEITGFDDLADRRVAIGREGSGIPIANKSITEFYPRAEIPAGTYRWQAKAVDTVAVKSVLISFDYRRRDCEHVGRFAQTLFENRPWLVQNGHPKWRSVDLDYQLRGWEQYDCVRRYLGKPAETPRARTVPVDNPVMDAIKQILGE
jgi:TRAP-type uncharacterized transport system substrate-binding protein